jgi:hypothetical protein
MSTIPLNKIRREDLLDTDFIDQIELSSDGYLLYRTDALLSTTNVGGIVTINPSSFLDLLDFGDQIVESLDRIYIYGSSAADGYYIVNQIIDGYNLSVLQTIPDSTGGNINFYYPAGATKVGIDSSNLLYTDKVVVQGALEDLNQYIVPKPTQLGQIMYSADSSILKFTPELPIVNEGDEGFILTNEDGYIVVS